MADFDPASDPEVIALFATEAGERLARLTACLDDLATGDPAVLDGCRREAHTLKGTAAMMGFADVAESARRLEDLLGAGGPPLDAAVRPAGGSDRSMLDVEAIRAEVATLGDRVAAAIGPPE